MPKVRRLPLHADQDLASAVTFSQPEHRLGCKVLYHLTQALLDDFVPSYTELPTA